MCARKVGNLGQEDFNKLCSASGLICNNSYNNDSAGWDSIVEFPLNNGINLLNSLEDQPIQCFVQIKATDGEKKSVQVKLSNMKRFCDSPLPCFFFFASYNGELNPVATYLVHINETIMFDVLKRIRENDVGKKRPLHKLTYTLSYTDEDVISFSDVTSLKKAIEKQVPLGIKQYSKNKISLLENLGYEDTHYSLKFKVATKEDYHSLVKASLGYKHKINIKDIKGWDTRFNVKLALEQFTSDEAIIEISSVDAFTTGQVIFKDDKEDVSFECKYYASPIAFNAPKEFASFRINNHLFDMQVGVKNHETKMSFASYDEKFDIYDLIDMLLLMKILNDPLGSLKVVFINNKGVETSLAASNNTFHNSDVANHIKKLEQSALALMQIANYFRISKSCKLSINELINSKFDIDNLYSVISDKQDERPVLSIKLGDPDFEMDCSRELHVFIALPLCFSCFSICLAFTASGRITNHAGRLVFDSYNVKVERLIRGESKNAIWKDTQVISEHVTARYENESNDICFYNSFSS